MNKFPLPLQHSVKSAGRLNMRIFIERCQCNIGMVERNEKRAYSPWITTAQEDVTCSVSAIVTRHPPTVDDVLSIINELAHSNFRRDILLPPELGCGTNHGISEIHIDSGADLRTAEFNSACISSGFVVVASTKPLQKTLAEKLLGNLDAALQVTRSNRVPAVKPVEGRGEALLMDSAAVTADELCEALRNIFERNFASIAVKVGRQKQ